MVLGNPFKKDCSNPHIPSLHKGLPPHRLKSTALELKMNQSWPKLGTPHDYRAVFCRLGITKNLLAEPGTKMSSSKAVFVNLLEGRIKFFSFLNCYSPDALTKWRKTKQQTTNPFRNCSHHRSWKLLCLPGSLHSLRGLAPELLSTELSPSVRQSTVQAPGPPCLGHHNPDSYSTTLVYTGCGLLSPASGACGEEPTQASLFRHLPTDTESHCGKFHGHSHKTSGMCLHLPRFSWKVKAKPKLQFLCS